MGKFITISKEDCCPPPIDTAPTNSISTFFEDIVFTPPKNTEAATPKEAINIAADI